MLIDHLTDGVAQEHDELVERVDLTLQLDSVYEINRTGTFSLRSAFRTDLEATDLSA